MIFLGKAGSPLAASAVTNLVETPGLTPDLAGIMGLGDVEPGRPGEVAVATGLPVAPGLGEMDAGTPGGDGLTPDVAGSP